MQAEEVIKLAQQAIGEAKNALNEKAVAEEKLKAVGFFSPEVQHNLQHSSFLTGVVVQPDLWENGSQVSVGAGVGTDGKPTFVVNFSVSNAHLLPQSEKFSDKLWREGAIIPIPADVAVKFLGQDGLKRLHDNINDRVRDPSFIQPAQFQKLLDENDFKISAAPGVNLQNVLAAVRQRGGMAKS